jgi:capsular polysaccharide export protein
VGDRPRHFLFLRGPFGPFFHQLAAALKGRGARVTKINFDTGDEVIWGLNFGAIRCPAKPRDAGQWLMAFMLDEGVTDLVCFNDCVAPHEDAIGWARDAGLSVHVFEEGYFRPHWITLDSGGVNVRSALPRDPDLYRQEFDKSQPDPTVAQDVGLITRGLVYATICHYLGKSALTVIAGPSPTPYAISTRQQMFGYIQMYFRRLLGMNNWPRVEADLLSGMFPYYLGLIQKAGDTQLTHNSDYDNETFIEAVLRDFAHHAPSDTKLAFKLHPMEPRMREQERFIHAKAREAGLQDRILVLDGGNLVPQRAGDAQPLQEAAGRRRVAAERHLCRAALQQRLGHPAGNDALGRPAVGIGVVGAVLAGWADRAQRRVERGRSGRR